MKENDIIVRDGGKYPDDALRVERVEEDGVVVYPLGGGMQGKIHVDHIGKYSVVADTTPHYRPAFFMIEGVAGCFTGWTDGTHWNGWARPLFEPDEAKRVAEEFKGRFENGRFITQIEDSDPEEWPAELIEVEPGVKVIVYGIGNGSWIWDECPPGLALCEWIKQHGEEFTASWEHPGYVSVYPRKENRHARALCWAWGFEENQLRGNDEQGEGEAASQASGTDEENGKFVLQQMRLQALDRATYLSDLVERAVVLIEKTTATRPDYQSKGMDDYDPAWKIIHEWRQR